MVPIIQIDMKWGLKSMWLPKIILLSLDSKSLQRPTCRNCLKDGVRMYSSFSTRCSAPHSGPQPEVWLALDERSFSFWPNIFLMSGMIIFYQHETVSLSHSFLTPTLHPSTSELSASSHFSAYLSHDRLGDSADPVQAEWRSLHTEHIWCSTISYWSFMSSERSVTSHYGEELQPCREEGSIC